MAGQPERRIIKAKRKLPEQQKILDEDGNELSMEDDDWEDAEDADCIDEQEVVQEDPEDLIEKDEKMVDEKEDTAVKKPAEAGQGPKVWNEEEQPLKEDEGMDFDSSAYEMLHRTNVEWPCLSLDVLVRERCTPGREDRSWFPSQIGNALTD